MKKITTIAIIAAFAVAVSGCDFIRQIAGRPTSNEIEAMEAAEAPADSLCCGDSLCCKDSLCCPDSLCCKREMPCDSCANACCGEAKPCEAKPECEAHSCEECDAEAAPAAEPVVEEVPVEKPACEAKHECEAKPCEAKPAPAAKPAPKAKPARIFRGPVSKNVTLPNKYYVVIGTFANPSNVSAQAARAEKAGYKVALVPFDKYLTAVAVNPTDNKNEAIKTLECVKSKKFCPKDAYILVVK